MQLTFLEDNLLEIPDIVKMAARLNIDRVKGHHLWVHFPQIKHQNLRRSADSVARWNAVVYSCRQIVSENTRPNGFPVKLEHFTPLEHRDLKSVAEESSCPFLGNEAWINHAGRFDPCCAPDDLRKGLGYFGEVQQRGFLNIWNGDQYRDLVRTYRNHELCRSCLMRK